MTLHDDHRLETLAPDFSTIPYTWYGECTCHNPDGMGWGRSDFHGATPQDVVDAQFDHAMFELEALHRENDR